jgi:hypothetical protein
MRDIVHSSPRQSAARAAPSALASCSGTVCGTELSAEAAAAGQNHAVEDAGDVLT